MTNPPAQEEDSRFRTFCVMWATQSLSLVGSAVSLFTTNIWLAAAWYPTDPHALSRALALNNAVYFVANLLVAPVAGVYVDRLDRKRIMLVANLFSGTATLLFAAVVWSESANLAALLGLMALVAAAGAFHSAAFDTAYVGLVRRRDLPRANGMMQTAWSLRGILGPPVAAILFGLPELLAGHGWHVPWIERLPNGAALGFVVDGITFLFATLVLALLHLPRLPSPAERRPSVLRDLPFGWTYIRARPPLLWLLSLFLVTNAAEGVIAVLVVVALRTDVTGSWAAWGFEFQGALALWGSATAFGGIVGGLVVTTWGGLRSRRPLGVVAAMILAGATLGAYGTRSYPVILAATWLHGFALPIMNVHSQAIWQGLVPSGLQGRVFAARRVIAQCSAPFGSLVGGLLGGLGSASSVVAVVGGVLVLAAAMQLLNRTLLDMEEASAEPASNA